MSQSSFRQIDLRAGEETLAKIVIDTEGQKKLVHQLSPEQLKLHLITQPFEDDRKLECVPAVTDGPIVIFIDESGKQRLALAEDEDGELVEVVDPKGDARLKVSLQDPGSTKNHTVQKGWLALELRRVISRPEVMMGKPVVRGTRITSELILRRLGLGATVADLLRDYPQLSTEDIQEVLLAAAKRERASFLDSQAEKTPKA